MRVRQEFVLQYLASPERKLGLQSGTETDIEAADRPGFVVTGCLVKPIDSC